MSTMPVPVRIGRPVTILADGESSVSERPFMAASVKKVMVVSKLICKKGELLFYRAKATTGGVGGVSANPRDQGREGARGRALLAGLTSMPARFSALNCPVKDM